MTVNTATLTPKMQTVIGAWPGLPRKSSVNPGGFEEVTSFSTSISFGWEQSVWHYLVCAFPFWRHAIEPTSAKPAINIANVSGSGTEVTVNWAAMKLVPVTAPLALRLYVPVVRPENANTFDDTALAMEKTGDALYTEAELKVTGGNAI
jgi:hypothetical protein